METPTLDHHHRPAPLSRALRWSTLLLPLLLAACGTTQQAPRQTAQAPATPTKAASTRPSNACPAGSGFRPRRLLQG
jgi:rare lipoprotein A